MLKIFSLITRCKQFSIGSIQILSRFSMEDTIWGEDPVSTRSDSTRPHTSPGA